MGFAYCQSPTVTSRDLKQPLVDRRHRMCQIMCHTQSARLAFKSHQARHLARRFQAGMAFPSGAWGLVPSAGLS